MDMAIAAKEERARAQRRRTLVQTQGRVKGWHQRQGTLQQAVQEARADMRKSVSGSASEPALPRARDPKIASPPRIEEETETLEAEEAEKAEERGAEMAAELAAFNQTDLHLLLEPTAYDTHQTISPSTKQHRTHGHRRLVSTLREHRTTQGRRTKGSKAARKASKRGETKRKRPKRRAGAGDFLTSLYHLPRQLHNLQPGG